MSFVGVKSVVLDFADNWGNFSTMDIRSIDFYLLTSKITISSSNSSAYATSTQSSSFLPEFAFDTSLSKTGSSTSNEWESEEYGSTGPTTNERLIIVFDSVQEFDGITINNHHFSGGFTNRGVKNIRIYQSTDTITDTVYGNSVSNSSKIFDGQLTEHIASDVVDDQELTLVETSQGDFDMSIPSLSLEMFPPDNITAEIPMLTAEINTGSEIVVSIPSLTLVSSGISAFPGHIVATIPPLFFSATTSATESYDAFDMEIPGLGLEINKSGDASLEIPSLSLSMAGRVSRIGSIKAGLPSLKMSSESGSNISLGIPFLSMSAEVSIVEAVIELTADIDGSIPSLRMRVASKPPDNILASIPMLTMSIIAEQSGDNDFALIIPALIASINSTGGAGDIQDDALRYVRGLVR